MRLKSIAAVVMLTAANLSAQAPVLGTLQYTGDLSNNGAVNGADVGPYTANLTGYNAQFGLPAASPATLVDYLVWCVDWDHYTTGSVDSYYSTAFQTNIGGIAGNGDFSKTLQNDENKYRTAAWLIEQYYANAAGFTAVNVQGTIWNLMGASLSGFTDLSGLVPVSFSLTQNWYVLSDAVVAGQGHQQTPHQEYLTSVARPQVPEPSTLVLLASGIFALGVASRRRSRI